MKHSLQISAIVDKPEQLEDMVEKLALKRFDSGYSQQIVPQNLKALETSSTKAFISGVVSFDDEKDHVSIPFITSFLFTCVKVKDEKYKMTWCASLS
jgi:hypothetical protein